VNLGQARRSGPDIIETRCACYGSVPMLVATVGDLSFSSDALLLELVASGDWAVARSTLQIGLACERSQEEGPSPSMLKAAETAFRRERRLLSGEDLRSWLGARDLSVTQWRDHLRRAVLVAAVDGDGEAPGTATGQEPVDDGAMAMHARPALLLDGLFASALGRLLDGAAAVELERDSGGPDPGPEIDPPTREACENLAHVASADGALPLENREVGALTDLAGIVLSLREARVRAFSEADDRRIRELFAERRLDWTRLDFEELALASESAAKEAVLCIRDDGLDLATVAERVGVSPASMSCTAADAGPAAAPLLLAATPGQPLGPIVGEGGGWRVLVLRARRVPEMSDAEFWNRARDEVVAERLNRHLAGKVRRHVEI